MHITACMLIDIFPGYFLQENLNDIAKSWNCHRIQRHRNVAEPTGRPILMHTSPQLYGTEDKLVDVDIDDVEACFDDCMFKEWKPCSDSTVFELCCEIMAQEDLIPPSDTQRAVTLYHSLRDIVNTELGL